MATTLAFRYPTSCGFGTKQWLQFLYVTSLVCLLQVPLSFSALDKKQCPPSSCGNIRNIRYPFRLANGPPGCGQRWYNIFCENNQTTMNLYNGKYKVLAINYNNFTIRLLDFYVDKNNCSSVPRFPISWGSFSTTKEEPYTWFSQPYPSPIRSLDMEALVFISCTNAVKPDSELFMDTSPCIIGINSSESTRYSYASIASWAGVADLVDSCRVDMVTLLPRGNYRNMPFIDVHRELAFGFELSWHNAYCKSCPDGCYFDNGQFKCPWALGIINITKLKDIFNFLWQNWIAVLIQLALLRAAVMLFIAPCLFVFLIRRFRRRHHSAYDVIEAFLHNQNNLLPIRYSYSDIKKMTLNFKDKLGEGGFGSVYKGKLRSSNLAAVKMLGKSKFNDQDFINEVATIGRIHHANIVRLIGYCVEGSKRALVYTLMPNGSLDKYIFGKEGYVSLTWEKLYDISLGIARGIEYLHRGCDMQILHFDIKPHNILLDENFNPKVSDFGLAKLYQTNDSLMTVTAARGTIGYMAPELFYKNIGRLSYKADVYSFGMMLLEIAGKRKKLNTEAENSSQMYFPTWIYGQLAMKNAIEIGEVEEEVNKMIKKMIMVGLWCIQMRPDDRPSMSKVIEMLEGDLENLQLPPRPLLYPEESPNMNRSSEESFTFTCGNESQSLMQNQQSTFHE